jgi:hypothetical protein
MPPAAKFGVVLLFALAVITAGPAAAQTLSDKSTEAEGLVAAGKFADALAALDEASRLVWDQAPLGCRRSLWVAEKASGFGDYNPRETDIFSSGEAMLVYAEPIGFGWRKSGEIWHAELVADIVIHSKDGGEIYHQSDFARLPVASRARIREFFVDLTYTLTGIPAGSYLLDTVLRDTNTAKQGTCTLPFEIR